MMRKSSTLTILLDKEGHLILPAELLAEYGIGTGTQVRLDQNPIGFTFSRSSDNLARVYIEPTNCCNLDCVTCMRNAWNEPPGKMSQNTFNKIITEITLLDHRPSIFFGGFGEPLTHPDILDMLAASKKVGSSVEMITNGILLNPETCSRLLELGLDRLWVSIDGATPESYADVRLGDALPIVIENLTTFKKMRKMKGWTFPKLGIAFVAMRRNIQDLPAVIRMGKKLGADIFSISNVLPHTPEMQAEALYSGPQGGYVESTSNWLPMLSLPRMEINEFTKEPILNTLVQVNSVEITRQKLRLGADICPFVEKGSISIRWDGAVSPCLALLHDHENFLDVRKRKSMAHIVGDINESTFLEIWKSQSYSLLRKRLLSFDFAYCTMCNSCDLADSNMEDCFNSPAPTCGGCLWAQGIIQCP
jgi:MoaA/NifB/PqqE/SkfB family radical SAM enzyme